jgi:colicin import membrane protein
MLIGPQRSGRAPSWEPVRFIIDQRRDGLVRALALSGVLHLALVWSLFIIPTSAARKGPAYESYTVDLVGGEKLGGAMPAPRAAPAQPAAPPEAKQESVKTKEEPTPRLTAKERRKIAAEHKAAELAERKAAELAEKALALKTKKETKKAEKIPPKKEEVAAAQKKEQELSSAVREKLIQAKLEQLREHVESEQVKQNPAPPPPPVVAARPGEGQGAVGPGVGGRGGGVFRGLEYAQYRNGMVQRIQTAWAWVGRRTDLTVTVQWTVQDSGEITGVKLIRSSGDASYDESVIRALKKVNPLPPLPEGFREQLRDWELDFTPKDLGR